MLLTLAAMASALCLPYQGQPSFNQLRAVHNLQPRVSPIAKFDDERMQGWAVQQEKFEARGKVVQIVVVAAIFWLFTLPPDIRRTKLCQPERGTGSAEMTYIRDGQCRTGDELRERIIQHYQTCGGPSGVPCVQFDFTIDQSPDSFISQMF